jgi:hypothetical protein
MHPLGRKKNLKRQKAPHLRTPHGGGWVPHSRYHHVGEDKSLPTPGIKPQLYSPYRLSCPGWLSTYFIWSFFNDALWLCSVELKGVKWMMNSDLEGSGRSLILRNYAAFAMRSWGKQQKPQWRQPVTEPRSEPRTFRIRTRSFNHSTKTFCRNGSILTAMNNLETLPEQ